MTTRAASAASLLSTEAAATLLGLPDTTEMVIRHCTLDEEDRDLVFDRRGAHNRLGGHVKGTWLAAGQGAG